MVRLNLRFVAPAAASSDLASAMFCVRCFDRPVGRGEALPERVVVPDLAGPEHDLRQLLRAIDHERDGPADARVLEHARVGPHADLAMSRGRQRVVLVLRVALERGALLRRQLHREVDLPCPEREHHRRAPLVEGDLDAVHRRRATPVRRVAHERRALLVDVVRELEGAGPDHPALDPRARIRGDRGGLDDRLVRGLAEQVREDADRRLAA